MLASEATFAKGDKVWSMMHGWGTVVTAHDLVLVEFSNGKCHAFENDGTYERDDAMPVLFHEEYRLVKEQEWDGMQDHCNELMDSLERMEQRAKDAEAQAATLLEINKNLSAALAARPAGPQATSWYWMYPVEDPNVANQGD